MRRSQTDSGSQVVRNIFANPSCETTSGVANVRTNNSYNPSMEAPGTTLTARTNLHIEPEVTTLSRFIPNYGTNGAGNLTRETTGGYQGLPYARMTWTTGQLPGEINRGVQSSTTNTLNVGVGTWTMSVWVRASQAQFMQLTHAGTSTAVRSNDAPIVVPANTWTRLSARLVVSVAGSVEIRVYSAAGDAVSHSWTAGETLDATAFLFEEGEAILPFFSGSTAVTNIATNPKATAWQTVAGTSGWRNTRWFGGGAGAGTYTLVSGATDGPTSSITTYARKTWTVTGNSNGDTGFDNTGGGTSGVPVLPNTKYTVSSYLRANGVGKSGGNLQINWYDAAGVIISTVMVGTVPLPQGVWVRLTNAATAPSNAAFLLCVSDCDSGTLWAPGESLDGTGLMIERGAVAASPTFYEGTGEFTYAWTGAVGTSTSTQSAARVLNRQALSPNTTAWQNSGWARTGTKSAAVLCNIAISGATSLWYPASEWSIGTGAGQLLANTVYTWSLYVWIPASAGTGAVRLVEAGQSVFGAQSTLYDQWERLSVTFTTPASGNVFMRIRGITSSFTLPAGTIFYVDDELMEAGSVAQPYFDGGTAAAGDYTYQWDGSFNNSLSRQRSPLPLKIGYLNAIPVSSTDWSASGSKSVRVVPTGSTADSFAYLTLPVLETGKTYTVLATLRMTTPQTGNIDATRARRIVVYHSNAIHQSSQAANVAGVTNLRLTFKVLDETAYQNVRLYSGASAGNGDVWFDNIMVVEGNYQGDYLDGTKPYSKWVGTAGDSTSVGYPPQFLDIAGKPSVDILGVGQNSASPVPVDGFTARTFYVVYETDAFTQAYNNCFAYGVSGSKGFLLQTAGAGSSSLANRVDFPGGSTNGAITMGSGRLTRRHVAAFTFEEGLATSRSCLNGANDVVNAWTVGSTGWDNGRVVTVAQAEIEPIRALVYYGAHDRATRIAISRYLGNKYGANVS